MGWILLLLLATPTPPADLSAWLAAARKTYAPASGTYCGVCGIYTRYEESVIHDTKGYTRR